VVTDKSCPHKILNPWRFVKNATLLYLKNKFTRNARTIFRTQVSHVSLKIVPFHLLQIHPLEGSNCIIIGFRAEVRTLSLINSSSRTLVETCSMTEAGVVNTIFKAVELRPFFKNLCLCFSRSALCRNIPPILSPILSSFLVDGCTSLLKRTLVVVAYFGDLYVVVGWKATAPSGITTRWHIRIKIGNKPTVVFLLV